MLSAESAPHFSPPPAAHVDRTAKAHEHVPDTGPSTSSPRVWNCPAAHGLRVALGRRPWERGRPARSGPQARHMGKRERRPRSQDTPITPRAVRLGRGGGRLGGVVPVGTLRAFGPVRARCPRSQDITPRAVRLGRGGWPARACHSCRHFAGLRPVAGKMPALPGHHSQGHTLGARASRPQAGHRPATWASGRDARAPRLLQRQSSAVHPRPASTALCASGGGVGGSGVWFLLPLCGPSARCGQDARAPRGRPRFRGRPPLPGHRSRSRASGGGVERAQSTSR